MVSKQTNTVLDREEYTTCNVNLHGGDITSWRINNKEQIYASPITLYDNTKHIRGGFCTCFPHYDLWDFGPRHGFARFTQWEVYQPPTTLVTDDIEATFMLTDNEYTRTMWPNSFRIKLRLTLKEKELRCELQVKNTDKYFSYPFDLSLHTYIRVPDVRECELIGLEGCRYLDEFTDSHKYDREECIKIDGPINRCYRNIPGAVTLTNVMQGRSMKIRTVNMPNLAVWNPWDGHGIPDLPPDDYLKMVNLTIGRFGNYKRFAPGEKFSAVWEFQVCEKCE